MEEARPVLSPSDSDSLRAAGKAAQWSRMHWCIVAVRINRLYGALQRQTNTRAGTDVAVGCVKLKTPPPVECDTRGVQVFISFMPLTTSAYRTIKFLYLTVLGSCQHDGMLTSPQTHTQTLKSSLNAKYPGWPAWERLSAKTHYGGEGMIICTIQGSALQHWHLCKRILPLSKHRINPIENVFLLSLPTSVKM